MWHAKQREATGLVVSAVYAAKGRPAKRAIDSIYSLPGKIYSIVLSPSPPDGQKFTFLIAHPCQRGAKKSLEAVAHGLVSGHGGGNCLLRQRALITQVDQS
jgi:hypothetical protein